MKAKVSELAAKIIMRAWYIKEGFGQEGAEACAQGSLKERQDYGFDSGWLIYEEGEGWYVSDTNPNPIPAWIRNWEALTGKGWR